MKIILGSKVGLKPDVNWLIDKIIELDMLGQCAGEEIGKNMLSQQKRRRDQYEGSDQHNIITIC